MRMRGWKNRAAAMGVALMLAGSCGMPVMAKARVVKAPAGVTVTKDSITVKDTAGSSAADDSTAGQAGNANAASASLTYDTTVLDADDFYYVRAGNPLIIAQAGQRFHNVRVTDPQYLVEPKLGSAFRKIDLGDNAAPNMEFYQDLTDLTCYLWVQYDANQTVQFLMYQRYPVAGG